MLLWWKRADSLFESPITHSDPPLNRPWTIQSAQTRDNDAADTTICTLANLQNT